MSLSPHLQFKCDCELCKDTIWLHCVVRLWWNRAHQQHQQKQRIDNEHSASGLYTIVVRHRILYYLIFMGTHQRETPSAQKIAITRALDQLRQARRDINIQLATVQQFNASLMNMEAKAAEKLDLRGCSLLWLPCADTTALDNQLALNQLAIDSAVKKSREPHLREHACFYRHHSAHINQRHMGMNPDGLLFMHPQQKQNKIGGLYACHLTPEYVNAMPVHNRALLTMTLEKHEKKLELQYEYNAMWSPLYRDRLVDANVKTGNDIDATNLQYWEKRLVCPENVKELQKLLTPQWDGGDGDSSTTPVFSFNDTSSWWSLAISMPGTHLRCYQVYNSLTTGHVVTGKSYRLGDPNRFYAVWIACDINFVSARAREQMFETRAGLYEWLLNQRRLINPRRMCRACFKICWEDKLERCARCYTAAYCNTQCQRNDWPRHKTECKKPDPVINVSNK